MAGRFDICEAYFCFLVDWNRGGLTRRCEAKGRGIAQQLHRMQFRPGLALGTDSLGEEAREVYDALVKKYHPEAPETVEPCPDCGTYVVEPCNHASREEQHGRYIDCGPEAWDDRDNPDY